MEVIALIGRMLSEPGKVAIILHNNVNDIPIRIQAKINVR
jgi:hypothetical protein